MDKKYHESVFKISALESLLQIIYHFSQLMSYRTDKNLNIIRVYKSYIVDETEYK